MSSLEIDEYETWPIVAYFALLNDEKRVILINTYLYFSYVSFIDNFNVGLQGISFS